MATNINPHNIGMLSREVMRSYEAGVAAAAPPSCTNGYCGAEQTVDRRYIAIGTVSTILCIVPHTTRPQVKNNKLPMVMLHSPGNRYLITGCC